MDRVLTDLARGGRTESSGAFTLDPALAIRKLALFQQAEPVQFLVLLVQAAVLSGAEKIQLKFGRAGVVATWLPDAEHRRLEPWKRLPELVQQAVPGVLDDPVEYVAASLQAALALDPLAAGWSFVDEDSSWALIVSDEGLLLDDGPGAAPEIRFVVRLRLEGNFLERLRQRISGHAEWLERLVARCGSCPVPIYADGRLMNWPMRGPSPKAWDSIRSVVGGLEQLRIERWVLGSGPRGSLLLAPPIESRRMQVFDMGPAAKVTSAAGFVTNYITTRVFQARVPEAPFFPEQTPRLEVMGDPESLYGPRDYHLRSDCAYLGSRDHNYTLKFPEGIEPGFAFLGFPPLLCHAMLSIADSPEPGKVILVQWGAALDPIEVELGCNGALAVVAFPCNTDLSRLCPVQDERFNRIADWCRGQIAEMMADVARLS